MSAPSLPEAEGHKGSDFDGRYRLYTVASGIDFDVMPTVAEGGPALVTVSGWRIVYSTSSDRDGYTLGAWRGDPFQPIRHQLDGTEYPTLRDAERAAWAAGLAGFMVYETRAFWLGLPVEVTAATDLGELVGVRVRIERPEIVLGRGTSVHYGVFESLRHSQMIPDSAGGMLLEEPHGTCRGGMTGFSVPYGSIITLAEGNH